MTAVVPSDAFTRDAAVWRPGTARSTLSAWAGGPLGVTRSVAHPTERAGLPQLRRLASVMVVRVTHAQAPVGVLERVSLDADGADAVARELLLDPAIAEAVVLSTCNRTELYVAGAAPDATRVLRVLATHTGAEPEMLRAHAACSVGIEVAAHAMRVAAGLESRAVGEVEILAQLRGALASARASGAIGPSLSNLFRFVLAAARQVRRTRSPREVPSLPQLALDAALAAHPATARTLVIGSGTMAALTVQELERRHADYAVCARRFDRAVIVARSPARVVPFDELTTAVGAADAVVCATGARSPLVTLADLARVMERRGERPLTIVDLSLPRNIDPDAACLSGLRLLDLDDLVCDARQDERLVEAMIAAHVERYRTWLAGQAAGPLIARLHDHVHGGGAMVPHGAPALAPCDADVGAVASSASRRLHPAIAVIKHHVAAGDCAAAYAVLTSYGL